MSVKIRASDLPSHVRQQLLDKLRDAAGDYQYTQLLDRFGEDGLLQMALDAAAGGSMASSAKQAGAKKDSILPVVLFFGALVLMCVLLGPQTGMAVFWTLYMVIQGISTLAGMWETSSMKAMGLPFGFFVTVIVLGLAALAGLVFGVLKAGPWLASGVRGWWGWLGSRF